MKTIYFKNGHKLEVSQHIVTMIARSVTRPNGASTLQCFNNGENTEIIINLEDISFIA